MAVKFKQLSKCPKCGSTGFDHPEYGHIDNHFKTVVNIQPEDGSGVPTYYTKECPKCGFSLPVITEEFLNDLDSFNTLDL